MRIDIHIHHHNDPTVEEMFMAVSVEIQTALDGIRQTQSLVKSVESGLAVQATMLTDQAAQIAALQEQIARGGSLHPDDLAALAEMNADITSVNTSLQADIPANTATAPTPAPVPTPAPPATPPEATTTTLV